MKKLLLLIGILSFTLSPCPQKTKQKKEPVYYNPTNYKYDDDQMIPKKYRNSAIRMLILLNKFQE